MSIYHDLEGLEAEETPCQFAKGVMSTRKMIDYLFAGRTEWMLLARIGETSLWIKQGSIVRHRISGIVANVVLMELAFPVEYILRERSRVVLDVMEGVEGSETALGVRGRLPRK
jgi:hypothetical protein